MATAPRILVVEDDPSVREAVTVALEGDGYEVAARADGTELAELLAAFRPDLVVLDIALPQGPDGLALARRVRASSDLPVVMLTARDAVSDRLVGFDAGADDYVVKPFAMAELVARVRSLLRRSGRLRSTSLVLGDVVVDRAAREVVRAGRVVDLTHTEYELLVALAERPGTAVSKERLLVLVWDFEAHDPNLVEVHISSLRRKLEASGPRIIHTVRGTGYLLRA